VIDLAGQLQLISPCSKATLAYDPHTGKELWRVHYSSFSSTARPLYGGGLLFLNTGFGRADLLAVRPGGAADGGDITATNVVWKLSKSVGSKPSALLMNDLLFIVHDSGVASCVEAKTGNVLWTKRLAGAFSASPIGAEGRAGREYEELAANHLDDGFMASPAVSGHALILRTKTNLYRLEQQAAPPHTNPKR
jgi:outer membrane protein assembly factor BamB